MANVLEQPVGTYEPSTSKSKRVERGARYLVFFPKILKLVKLVKLLKFGKILTTFISMALSVIVYSLVYGPRFAVGFVVLMFIHELGHVVALNRRGYPVRGPVFIPFLGAALFIEHFNNPDDEAFIGIGGPILGTVGALATFAAWSIWPSPLLLGLAYMGSFLNLFNMIPIRPLDGGRITQAVGPWFKWAGVAIMLALTFALHNPGLILLWILILDDFKMQRSLRAVLSTMFFTIMVGLMVSGYSPQPQWADYIDITVGALLTLIHCIVVEFREHYEAEPPLPAKTRAKWLAAYVMLASMLFYLMSVQVHLLPKR